MKTWGLALFAGGAAATLLSAPPAAAAPADEPPAHCAGPPVGWVPRELAERPVGLRAGIGRVADGTSTSSPGAQAFYEQGLAYLHAYVWIEAARSFNQALRLDPEMSMAHWGLSRALSGLGDQPAALAAIARARRLAASANERERRRIRVRELHLEAIAALTDPGKHAAYKKALDEALASDFGDVELWLLRGNAEEPLADGRGQRGRAASVAFYRQALALSPRHPAAHHYLVHSYEMLGRTPDALRHGQTFADLAPQVPHAQHMYGHDLARAGRTDEAIRRFERAYALETAYYRAENVPSKYDWHHEHNIDLLALAYQHQGKLGAAERLLRRAFEIAPLLEGLEFNKRSWPSFLLSRRRSAEALEAATVLARGRWPSTRAVGQVMTGQAQLQLGRTVEAQASLKAAEKELAAVPVTAASLLPTRAAVEPYVEHLRGELLLHSGRTSEGAALLTGFAKKIRALPGPDAWSLSSFRLEAVALVARQVGAWALAESTAREMIDHDPSYAGAHHALGLVARHQGDLVTARRELALAARLWRGADRDMAELKDGASVLNRRPSP